MFFDHALDFVPSGFSAGSYLAGGLEVAILAADKPAIHVFEIGGSPRIKRTSTIATSRAFRYITSADMNRDRLVDYVAIAKDGRSLSVFIRSPRGSWRESLIRLSSPAERCVVADLNNDGWSDILLFGKSSGGVATLIGRSRNRWREGPVLFPETSAGDLKVADINGDGVTDILLLNWLSDQLTVFYGIGRFTYTEQVAMQLDSEPAEFAVTPISNALTFLVAITCPDERKVVVYSGNSLGDYRPAGSIQIGEKARAIQFAELNNDEDIDIVTTSRMGMHVAFGSPAAFTKPVVFGTARSAVQWSIVDVDRDGKDDCILLDAENQRLSCLLNADSESKLASHLAGDQAVEFAVGASPNGLVVGDLNGNGRNDIAVANLESSTLSVLLHKGRGMIAGQVEVPVPEGPRNMRFVLSGKVEKTLVTSHPSKDLVSLVALDQNVAESATLSFPTGRGPYVVHAAEESGRLKFLVRYKARRDRSLLLSLFEQIADGRFVEQSMRTASPAPIVALTASHGGSIGSYEFVYATNDTERRRTTVWHSISEGGAHAAPHVEMFSFPDSTSSTHMIFHDYVNRDGLKDVVVVLGEPDNKVGIWYNKGSDTSRFSMEWIRDVQPLDEDSFLIKDINGDDLADLTWIDGMRKAVVVVYGTERRGTRRPVEVVRAEGVRSIRVANVREVGANDLILSNSERGTVSIITNPFQR